MALTSVANYKSWAGIDVTTWDTPLAAILTEAEAEVAKVLDRRLEDSGSDITEYYDGKGTEVIFLQGYPVTSITSVSYLSGVTSGAATYTAYTSSEYYADSRGWLVRYSGFDYAFADDYPQNLCWPVGIANIKVVYKGGYTSSTVPADILETIYEVMSLILHSRNGTRADPVTEGDLRAVILQRIGSYRRQSL